MTEAKPELTAKMIADWCIEMSNQELRFSGTGVQHAGYPNRSNYRLYREIAGRIERNELDRAFDSLRNAADQATASEGRIS